MNSIILKQSVFNHVSQRYFSVCALRFSRQDLNNDDYQYLQRSKVATLHFQKSLPRLPIPELKASCDRYLEAQKPLIDQQQEYERVRATVDRMLNIEGPPLQKELKAIDAANRHTSFISAPWFNMYLEDRRPLPINYNPFLVFIDDPNVAYNHQLIRSTNLLISSLRFMKSLRANILEPEVFHLNAKKSDTAFFRTVTSFLPPAISWYGAYLFKAFPLDMSQYENLFNTSRIPKNGKDVLYHDSSTRHIVVMRKGRFFKMDVLDDAGLILSPQDIFSSLDFILNQTIEESKYPIGILTTEDRNKWASARKYLESIGNAEVLKIIDGALFCLILDESTTREYDGLVREYLHSDGRNRWFDKSFSLIVQKNGIAGLNFEHSWGDGVAVLRYFQDIYKDSSEKPKIHPGDKPSSTKAENLVKNLDFKLDDKCKKFICEALENYKNTTDALDINLLEFVDFGRNICKRHKISPDSIMQLAFQIAYYKQNRKFVSTYESCSTAAFKHGRTETMRPCTMATKEVCLDMFSKDKPSKETMIAKIKNCSTVHGQLVKEAAMGQGFDRHLFALRVLAEKNAIIPELYKDPAFLKFNHYILSTSTLNSDALMLGAFGPVVPDGYGIGYSIWNDRLGSIVSNYKDNTDGNGYIECLKDALSNLYNYLK